MSAPVQTAAVSLRVLLQSAIDYAGLYPPASLDMRTAVSNYARYLEHPQRWALGRFVLPVARLDEFLNAQENIASEPWHLSAIISADPASELAAVAEFNRTAPSAVIDSIEARVAHRDQIYFIRSHQPAAPAPAAPAPAAGSAALPAPAPVVVYEVAHERAAELLTLLHQLGAVAKIRTGGVVPDAIPSVQAVAAFLARCAELNLRFKATAGLHHPLRSLRPLTYQKDSPEAVMHGFLNLFTASAIAWSAHRRNGDSGNGSPGNDASGNGEPLAAIATCLADQEPANFHFADDALTWSGDIEPMYFNIETLREVRSNFALSFGSCSFEDPIADLRNFGLL